MWVEMIIYLIYYFYGHNIVYKRICLKDKRTMRGEAQKTVGIKSNFQIKIQENR